MTADLFAGSGSADRFRLISSLSNGMSGNVLVRDTVTGRERRVYWTVYAEEGPRTPSAAQAQGIAELEEAARE